MPLPVQLRAVADEMQFGGDDWTAYINRKTGELASFPGGMESCLDDEESAGIALDWDEEMVADYKRFVADKDVVALPSKFDSHEYAIMERFCLTVDDEQARDRLLDAIRGRGAFRRFKDLVRRLGIDKEWYRHRDDALQEIAADFLEATGIPYVDDRASGGAPPAERD